MYKPTITFTMNAEAFIMLNQQKLELQKLISSGAPDILEGLVNMIDHIQDRCVDDNNIPEDIVFPKIIEGSIQEELPFPISSPVSSAPTTHDDKVLGVDTNGCLILWDANRKKEYNCGETLEQFGADNLSEKELSTIMYCRGIVVISKDGTKKGKLTGGSRLCGMEGCTGKALAVRWEDKKLTYPCTKGMNYNKGIWQIG